MSTVAVMPAPSTGRKLRSPKHSWNLRTKPFLIQPCMIAPVLPGETMKKLMFQSRVVTDPIKNPLIGWWKEYYFFYVKLRDLSERDKFSEMVVDPTWDAAAQGVTTPGARQWGYYPGGSKIDWTYKCLERVVTEYFRDEAEPWNSGIYSISGQPLASIVHDSWLNSVTPNSKYVTNDPGLVVGGDDTIKASEIDDLMAKWDLLRMNNLTDMSFEDYLGTFGVSRKSEDDHIPELIRYVRDWQYPTNTVEATTGVPSSAVSWGISERADKDRFFREPGFIFGVTVTRPKVYLAKQTGSAVWYMSDAWSWLPAVLRGDPTSKVRPVPTAAGSPIPTAAEAYWVDVGDLLMYGDQFVNFALTETDAGLVGLPTTALERRYVADADITALFVTPASKYLVREDGMAQLSILGAQTDTTPRGRSMII